MHQTISQNASRLHNGNIDNSLPPVVLVVAACAGKGLAVTFLWGHRREDRAVMLAICRQPATIGTIYQSVSSDVVLLITLGIQPLLVLLLQAGC